MVINDKHITVLAMQCRNKPRIIRLRKRLFGYWLRRLFLIWPAGNIRIIGNVTGFRYDCPRREIESPVVRCLHRGEQAAERGKIGIGNARPKDNERSK